MKIPTDIKNPELMDAVVLRAIRRLGCRAISRNIRNEVERMARVSVTSAAVFHSLQRLEKAGHLKSEKPTSLRFYLLAD